MGMVELSVEPIAPSLYTNYHSLVRLSTNSVTAQQIHHLCPRQHENLHLCACMCQSDWGRGRGGGTCLELGACSVDPHPIQALF